MHVFFYYLFHFGIILGTVSEEALQIAEGKKKRSERQRRKGKICPSECKVPKKMKKR